MKYMNRSNPRKPIEDHLKQLQLDGPGAAALAVALATFCIMFVFLSLLS